MGHPVSSPTRSSGPRAAPNPPWGEGALIGGRYRLRSRIGAGAMGEVWLAEHTGLGSSVAVKLVDTAAQEDGAEALARFDLEARAAAQLRTPHVVAIVDHGADGPVAFITMELLEGESLERRLEIRGKLSPLEVARVLTEAARAMDRAHALGIVHRDLKPSNVFLARVDGIEVVKVVDFGIAKVLRAPANDHLKTKAGFVVGTPAYMSPEQVMGLGLDTRSDLWQLAILAFECLTGKRPFDEEGLGRLFMMICQAPMPVPSAFARVPAGFDEWFARAASREPSQRFASAGEMAETLTRILAPEGLGVATLPMLALGRSQLMGARLGASPSSPPRAAWATATTMVRPRSRLAGMVAVGLAVPFTLGAAALAYFTLARPSTGPSAGAMTTASAAAVSPPPSAKVAAAPSASAAAASPTASASGAASAAPAGSAKPRAPSGGGQPKKAPVDLGI